ncbi:uncharacterized protein B0T15DRAFT_535622 [Chaetomium strumarium]|uniref:Biogenesis of lysosome-related organelles complex 1 subunit 1 n=1 Tax=Chaetomium strumarium TaxID=1170767 RepID=A0AAJ0GQ61_9PEZI|nr:hypothetical protein B0T15DRAFT_535622 [Chaetomium strumarium]
MPSSAAAPISLTTASITPAQPSAASVSSVTATAFSPSTDKGNNTRSAYRRASIFSSLLSRSTTRPTPKPSSPPSVASSSVSVSVSTTSRPHPPSTSITSTTTRTTTATTLLPTTPSSSSIPPSTTIASSSSPLPPRQPILRSEPPSGSGPILGSGSPLSLSGRTSGPDPVSGSGPLSGPSGQREIEQARSAVIASIGNLFDRELTSRARLLHANNAAIEKQERDVARATEALRKENDKLGKLAETHAGKVKEIGNVQNWAEMLEREFLILEETLRLVNGGGSGGGEEGSGSEWSGRGSSSQRRDGEGDVAMSDAGGPETVPLPGSPPV